MTNIDGQPAARNGIQVISRAAAILRVLRENPDGMSLGKIAAKVDLPRSTVQRIVGALQEERMVIAESNGSGLRLGPELNALGDAASFNVVDRCRLLLSDISAKTGETADLSVLRGASMIFLDQAAGSHRLRAISSVGEVFPLTTTANGRACLAELPEDEARRKARAEWKRSGQVGEIEPFMQMLARIRSDGLAYDLNDHTDGISAIGFAFRDWSNDVLAISVPIPSSRFEEVRPAVEQALRTTADSLRKMVARTP